MDRSERRFRTEKVVARRKNLWWRVRGEPMWRYCRTGTTLRLATEEEMLVRFAQFLGRCRTRSPFDCGRSRCHLDCNPRRLYGNGFITMQERKSLLDLREQLDEND